MVKKIIETQNAPAAIGPYSQGTIYGNLIFCSGQIALCPDGTSKLSESVAVQCHQALMNLKAVLTAAGGSLETVLKVNVSLVDMNDFSEVNEVYESFFNTGKPARACVAVAGLPRGAKIEIEAIATLA